MKSVEGAGLLRGDSVLVTSRRKEEGEPEAEKVGMSSSRVTGVVRPLSGQNLVSCPCNGVGTGT